jgi:hypothetical protein
MEATISHHALLLNVSVLCTIAAAVAAQEEQGVIEGTVLDPEGAPCFSREVTLYALDKDRPARTARYTDAAGAYRFDGLRPGAYLVYIRVEDAGVEAGRPFANIASALADGTAARVQIVAGERSRRDVRLPRYVSVAGILSCRGAPVKGAVVELAATGSGAWTVGRKARTDHRGHFRAEKVPEGDYAAIVRVSGVTVELGSYVCRDAESRLDLVLGDRTARINVSDCQGKPIRDAHIRLSQVRGSIAVEVSGADQGYVMPYLSEGEFCAVASVDAVQATATVSFGPVVRDADVAMRLPPMGTILVRAVDAVGVPQGDVQIRIEDRQDGRDVFGNTSREGLYRLRVPAHRWHVGLAHGLAFKGVPQSVEVEANAVADVIVRTE